MSELQKVKTEIQRQKKVISDACGGVIVSKSNCVEYNTLCKLEEYVDSLLEDHIVDKNEMVDMEWLTPQLDKSYEVYGERKMMELTKFDGYAMLDAIAFGRQQAIDKACKWLAENFKATFKYFKNPFIDAMKS